MMKKFPYDIREFAKLLLLEIDRTALDQKKNISMGEFTFWTTRMKFWLSEQAKRNHCRAIYTDQQGMSEFMLDLVWWQNGPEGSSALLACEIEWGNTRDPHRNYGRVAEDFDKLLNFKAPFKLMLFDSYKDIKTQVDVIQELNRYLREYGDHRAGEQYLVIDVSPFKKAWSCDILQEGEDKSLELRLLDLF